MSPIPPNDPKFGQATAKLLAEFIRRLQPQMHHDTVSLGEMVETAKLMLYDTDFLAPIFQETCKGYAKPAPPKDDSFRHRRTFHFRRLVIHYFMKISDQHQDPEHPISRHWLLQWYDILGIALGKDCFIQPHELCVDLVNELKHDPEFEYNNFFSHPAAMLEYAILMTKLASFIEVNPKKRIEWLVNAMASNPNLHVVNGVLVHTTSDAPPPSFDQIRTLILGVFEHIFKYVQTHSLEDAIQHRLGHQKLPPNKLFNHLLVHIESLDTEDEA